MEVQSNEVVLVTGGTRGIGRAIVESLSKSATMVAFTWRSKEDLARHIERQTDGAARAFHLDLKDRELLRPLIEEIETTMGPLVGLVNNAGIESSSLLALSSDDTWDHILDINLGGTFRMCREVVRPMIRRRRGSIVNVASLSAFNGIVGQSAYAASKAGVLAVTRCLSREVGRFGIRVNAVVPGFVDTDMTAGLSPEAVEQLRGNECLTDGVTPEDVAVAVAFLLSDSAAAITGQTMVIDAGTTA